MVSFSKSLVLLYMPANEKNLKYRKWINPFKLINVFKYCKPKTFSVLNQFLMVGKRVIINPNIPVYISCIILT